MRTFYQLLKLLLMPFQPLNKEPVLWRGKGVHVVYFGLFAAGGTFFGVLLSAYYLSLRGVTLGPLAWLYYLSVILTLWFSARMGHLIALGRKFFQNPSLHLRETRFYVQGGIIGLIPLVIALSYFLDVPVSLLMDSLAYGGLIALFIGRLGCYNYGCCYGLPTSAPCAVTYNHPDSKILRIHPELNGVPIHPTQLYTAYCNLAAFAVVTIWLHSSHPPREGAIAVFFFLYHGTARYFLDKLRYIGLFDHRKGKRLPNVALLTIALGVLLWLVGPWLSPSFLSAHSILVSKPSLAGLLLFLSDSPFLLLVSLISSGILFLGYGVHGKTLGTFAKVKNRGGT